MNNKNEKYTPYADSAKNPNIFSQALRDPILGKHFKLSGQNTVEKPIKLDTSLSYIPVYSHLKIHEAEFLKRPLTPPALKIIEKEGYMDFNKLEQINERYPKVKTEEPASSKREEKKTTKILS